MNMSLAGLCTSFSKVTLFSLPEVFCGPQVCQKCVGVRGSATDPAVGAHTQTHIRLGRGIPPPHPTEGASVFLDGNYCTVTVLFNITRLYCNVRSALKHSTYTQQKMFLQLTYRHLQVQNFSGLILQIPIWVVKHGRGGEQSPINST